MPVRYLVERKYVRGKKNYLSGQRGDETNKEIELKDGFEKQRKLSVINTTEGRQVLRLDGNILVGADEIGPLPILTVELYDKWYSLFLITRTHDEICVEVVYFDVLEEFVASGESAYCDHVPNPRAVSRFADAKGYHLPGCAYELMVGRWEIEYKDRY